MWAREGRVMLDVFLIFTMFFLCIGSISGSDLNKKDICNSCTKIKVDFRLAGR